MPIAYILFIEIQLNIEVRQTRNEFEVGQACEDKLLCIQEECHASFVRRTNCRPSTSGYNANDG